LACSLLRQTGENHPIRHIRVQYIEEVVMGIDRIGKGGAAPPTPETPATGGAEKKGGVERPFQVERPDPTQVEVGRAQATANVDAAQATSEPLARLRAGEVDVHGYIDLKVDEATSMDFPPPRSTRSRRSCATRWRPTLD
jgi:hypothetical protein